MTALSHTYYVRSQKLSLSLLPTNQTELIINFVWWRLHKVFLVWTISYLKTCTLKTTQHVLTCPSHLRTLSRVNEKESFLCIVSETWLCGLFLDCWMDCFCFF